MEHTLEQLAEQLGIPNEKLDAFVAENKPLESSVSLADAPFWSRAQASFLAEAIRSDDPWSIAAGQLDALLRD